VEKKEVVDIIDTRPVLSPHGMVLDQEKDVLWISYEETENREADAGGLAAIDLGSRKVVKKVESGKKTHWFVMKPDGKKAYTCNKTADFISILDLEKGVLTGKIAASRGTEEPGISRDGKLAYFPTPGTTLGENAVDPKVLVIDTDTDQVVHEIKLEWGVQSVYVTAKDQVMVSQYRFSANGTMEKGKLSLFDGKNYALMGETEIGSMPLTMRDDGRGEKGFIANIFEGTVSVVDLAEGGVLKTLGVDNERDEETNSLKGAHGMVYRPSRV